MEYETDTVPVQDLDDLVALHRLLMPRRPGFNRSYLRWKYLENPFMTVPLLVRIRLGSETVGMRGAFGTMWRDGEGELVVPHADDLVVHPAHRDRGLFLPINRALVAAARERGFPALIGVSGGSTTQRLALATGWSEARDLDRRFRSVDRYGMTDRSDKTWVAWKVQGAARRVGLGFPHAPSERRVDRAAAAITAADGGLTVTSEPDVETLADISAGLGSHASSRSPEAIAWRYRNPDRRYRFVMAGGESIEAYLVLAWTHRAGRVEIVDHASPRLDEFERMIRAVASIDSTVGIAGSSLTTEENAVMAEYDFTADDAHVVDSERRCLVYRLGGSAPFDAARVGTWRMDMIDTMLV